MTFSNQTNVHIVYVASCYTDKTSRPSIVWSDESSLTLSLLRVVKSIASREPNDIRDSGGGRKMSENVYASRFGRSSDLSNSYCLRVTN